MKLSLDKVSIYNAYEDCPRTHSLIHSSIHHHVARFFGVVRVTRSSREALPPSHGYFRRGYFV